MRSYATIKPTFWTGPTGQRMRKHPDGDLVQLVALYLVTGPGANLIGLYHSTPETIAIQIGGRGRNPDTIRRVLDFLSEIGFAYFDPETETVFVPQMAHYQVGEKIAAPSDGRRFAVIKQLRAFEHSPFFSQFLEQYAAAYGLSELVPKVPTYPRLTPPAQEHEQDQVQDQGLPHPTPPYPGREGGRVKDVPQAEADAKVANSTDDGRGSGSPTGESPARHKSSVEPEAVVQAWNTMARAAKLRVVAKLTDTRRKAILKRGSDQFWAENWAPALERLGASPFCCGSGERGWRADFDFFLREETVVRLIEGTFDDWAQNATRPASKRTQATYLAEQTRKALDD